MVDKFDVFGLDDVIYGKLRLGLMVYFFFVESVSFNELKDKIGVSDGNLLVYLRKLEDVGYVGIEK